MIARIEFEYTDLRKLQQLPPDDARWCRLREVTEGLPENPAEFWSNRQVLCHLEDALPVIDELGVDPIVKRYKGCLIKSEAPTLDGGKQMKVEDYINGLKLGTTVQVHIPNLGLLSMDEVDWMENACTQALQARLDEGWRILAVCPPNMERRPTYILGRTRPRT